MEEHADIAIIGAGAAGLFAGIWAGRTAREQLAAPATSSTAARHPRIIALDGAAKIGAKILVAGGGRCNVTHHQVDESAYAGSSRNAIKKVLLRFDVPTTIKFFADLGVMLKREETGKLFPTTDKARTVLDALLAASRDAGVELVNPWRVASITRTADGFRIERERVGRDAERTNTADRANAGGDAANTHDDGADLGSMDFPADATNSPADSAVDGAVIFARRVILCTGGMALPKTGSDGQGFAMARSLGHTITPLVTPALVPLLLAEHSFIRGIPGITLPTMLSVRAPSGKLIASFTNSTLTTHVGLSGPGPLDISRYYFAAAAHDHKTKLTINWLPMLTTDTLDNLLVAARQISPLKFFQQRSHQLPERLVRAVCQHVRVDPVVPCDNLPRERRRDLAVAMTAHVLPISGHRGYTFAEATAGGVPLSELHLETMESRVCPGLHIAGEICDVDGRIGGFNFQWAWASGFVAGSSAAKALAPQA